jgi:hypothetical protein
LDGQYSDVSEWEDTNGKHFATDRCWNIPGFIESTKSSSRMISTLRGS